jgi:serine/threonine-protein kinase
LEADPASIVNTVLDGQYQMEALLGTGGMGAVYRARHILLGDQVVIKTLRPEMRGNAEWLKRFQREGKAARAFRHPNSVTVYDLSSGSDGMIYMVMEYVEGHTLDQELKRRGRFTPAEALDDLEPVADVLDAAHGRGVVHRDLKPENIMLGSDGRGGTVVKVLDLGIAKIVGAGDVHAASATSLTVAGQILGTPYYMSPEQWGEMPRDGNPEVDGRTDVYSLGVIFFELVAGKKPLGGTTLSELRQKHVASPLPLLGEVAPGVPAEFGRAVAHAMAKDRGDRPQGAGLFVDELRASLGLPARGRSTGPRSTGPDSLATVNAGRDAGLGEAATAHLSHETGAVAGVNAATLLTSEFETPGAGRETGVQGARHTSGGAGSRREGARGTVAHGAGTHFDAAGHPGDDFSGQGAGVSVTAPEPRRSLAPLVAGGALALLLIAGVGGWLAWRAKPAQVPAPDNPARADAPPPAVPKVEAASYWFETFEKDSDRSGKRVAELAPSLASGRWFKFHIMTRESGYLYIVGPGAKGNARMTFLTMKGARSLKSNYIGAVADFAFPYGTDKPFWVDETPGADVFNFVFSPTPLMSPAFLTAKTERELTPEEIAEFEKFRTQYKADAPEQAVKGEGDARVVSVLAPEPATKSGKPLIFDVRFDHR